MFTKGLIWFYEKETRLQVEIVNETIKELITKSNENLVIEMDLSPINNDLMVRMAPEYAKEDRTILEEMEGFKKYDLSRIQISDYTGEIKMKLAKKLCLNCKKLK